MSFNFMAAVTICGDFGAQKSQLSAHNLSGNVLDTRDTTGKFLKFTLE